MISDPANPSPTPLPSKTLQERFPPRRQSLAGRLWGLRTRIQKELIAWQDRFGWFSYADWIRSVERAQRKELARQASVLAESSSGLLVFVIDSSEIEISQAALEATLRSFQSLRMEWRLVILIPTEHQLDIAAWLTALADGKEQVNLLAVDSPSAITSTSANLIHLADRLPGDWLVPWRAGDLLSSAWEDAWKVFVQRYPQADIFYWDEDQLSAAGERTVPFFKPDWSPELLLAVNYLESAAVRKRLLLEEAIQKASEGSGLFLSYASVRQIVHIPVVLQHRAPLNAQARQSLQQRHARSIRTALEYRGYQGVKVGVADERLDVRWNAQPALVSIIIPSKNNAGHLKRCLGTLMEKTTGVDYEIIVMDDHSTDTELLAYYEELQERCPTVCIHHNQHDFNYSQVNNEGARLAKGDLLLFLNNDVEILDGGWLEEMVRWVQVDGVGIVGAKLFYPNRTIQHAGIVVGMTGHAGHLFSGNASKHRGLFFSADTTRNVSAVTGACMLVRREVFEQLAGFDEDLVLVFNDVDLCLRALHSGWRIVYASGAALLHYEGLSRSRYMPPRDIRLGAQQLSAQIEQGDACYNPNLSLAVNWPTLRRPGEPAALQRLQAIVRYKGSE